jgi:hypothetical protein
MSDPPGLGSSQNFKLTEATPKIAWFHRACHLKRFGIYFIKIGPGNQKLWQFEYRDFRPYFGRQTLDNCIRKLY